MSSLLQARSRLGSCHEGSIIYNIYSGCPCPFCCPWESVEVPATLSGPCPPMAIYVWFTRLRATGRDFSWEPCMTDRTRSLCCVVSPDSFVSSGELFSSVQLALVDVSTSPRQYRTPLLSVIHHFTTLQPYSWSLWLRAVTVLQEWWNSYPLLTSPWYQSYSVSSIPLEPWKRSEYLYSE